MARSTQGSTFSRRGFADAYPYESHFVEVDGHQMHYVDEGSGETLLLLHGNPTWSFYWRRVIDHFSDEYRVVAPDHIGYGMSDKPAEFDYTVSRQAENVETFVETLGLTDLTLVLHDWGGAWGMGYATEHPENVKRLVITNTGAFTIPDDILENPPWQLLSARIPFFGKLGVRGLNLFSRLALYMAIERPERRTSEFKKGLLAPYDSWSNRVAVYDAVADIPMSESDPAHAPLERMESKLHLFEDTPKVFFWGMEDFVFDDRVLDRWLDFYPDAEVHRYEDAGHYSLQDAHERIIPAMDSFLESNPLS